MNKVELKILQILDASVRRETVSTVIEAIVARVEQKLIQDPEALLAWEPVSLDTYDKRLPVSIQSSWVFVLRASANTGAEKHPNSRQRMISYRGSGDLQIWDGGKWCSNLLVSDSTTGIENRCLAIPPDTWHQAVVPKDNWVVVSFHTVPADELIEERSDPTNTRLTLQRRYLNAQ